MNARGPRHQRGSVLVLAAFGLGIALACLMVLDVAHVFTAKRDLQKVADLAVLAGARLPGNCADMQARAEASAAANGHAANASRRLRLECGTWTEADGFTAGAAAATALRATAARDVPYFFMIGSGREIEAAAIARNQAYDVFSLGTGLATVHAGALNALLTALLGTSVDLDLLSWQGLASNRLRLLDLIEAGTLDVGTVRELLDADVRLADLVLAMAEAVSASRPLSATVLRNIAAGIPAPLRVRLADVVDVQLADTQAAAMADIQLLDLLLAAAQVANGDNLLDLGASVPANPLASVGLKLRIVEPPKLAIGPEGTQARSAQVRLLLDLRLLNLTLPAGLASATGLRLPLAVEAAPGVATLQRMECESDPADCAVEFGVRNGLVRACVGTDAGNVPGCAAAADIIGVEIKVLNVTLARVAVTATAVVDASSPVTQDVRFGSGGFAGSAVTDSHWAGNAPAGASLPNVLAALPTGLALEPQVTLLGLDLGGVVNGLVAALLGSVTAAIADLTTAVLQPLLVSLVDPLLAVLGVRTGGADLHQIELHCGAAELVR